MESLNIFFEDKRQAMSEYMRVTKPGGYVGITEMTWLEPPLPEYEELFMRVVHAGALEANGWTDLMEESGLEEVVGNAYQIDIPLTPLYGSDLEYRYEVVAILIDWITLIVSGVLLSVFFRRAERCPHHAGCRGWRWPNGE